MQTVLNQIREWAVPAIRDAGVDTMYIFGSLVQDGGKQFDPQTSDIDLITALKPDETICRRIEILDKLHELMGALELLLLRSLGRTRADRSIVSNVVLTATEIEYSIHKSGDRKLLSFPRFLNLALDKNTCVGLSSGNDEPAFLSENSDQLAIIRTCQDKRTQFVANSVSEHRAFQPYDGIDAIPKDIMRNAAILAWNRDEIEDDNREDLIDGMSFFQRKLEALKNQNKIIDQARIAVGRRRTSRGIRQPLSQTQLLVLYEILFDEAVSQLVPSIRRRLDTFISNTESNNKK